MPRGDGMGPAGMGPLTGRSTGFCAGFKTPGFMNAGYSRGIDFGRRRRFGRMFFLAGLLSGCGCLAYLRTHRRMRK